MENRTARLDIRLTQKEKAQVQRIAARCGLSLSEYLRQRALGYAPREIPPDAYYYLCDKLDDLRDRCDTPYSDSLIQTLTDDIRTELQLPMKESISEIRGDA